MSDTETIGGQKNLADSLAIVRPRIVRHGLYDGVETALTSGENLAIVARAMLDLVAEHDLQFQAIGARGVYAEAVARAMALAGDSSWFSVRQKLKGRGTNSWTEGAHDLNGKDVIVVDAFAQADTLLVSRVVGEIVGANVVGILPVVDFDEGIREHADALHSDIPYIPLISRDMLATA
jgi:orotate phosphoribosyltransferase